MTGPDGAVPRPELLPGEVQLPLEFDVAGGGKISGTLTVETRGGDGPGDWKVAGREPEVT